MQVYFNKRVFFLLLQKELFCTLFHSDTHHHYEDCVDNENIEETRLYYMIHWYDQEKQYVYDYTFELLLTN